MKKLIQLAEKLKEVGVDSYFVGGCIRDELMGLPVEDIDVCLVGATSFSDLADILQHHCDSVIADIGAKFPVAICTIDGVKYDFALARGEKKDGDTRKDFFINTKGVTIEDDLGRRDLTINAIAKNVITGEYIDPYDGMHDIQHRIAREVSNAFAEDTLRVLRAGRFIARFQLRAHPSLIRMCKSLVPTDISPERVGMEVMKLFKQADEPAMFFSFLRACGWLQYHFKELDALCDVQQDPMWHPEGNAFVHTLHTLDATKKGDWFTRAVMLCHDLGKAVTTQFIEGKWRARGHEEAGVPLADDLLKRIHFTDHRTINQIKCLVRLHMIHTQEVSEKVVRRTLRQLSLYKLEYDQLVEVCRCDKSGRPPLPACTPDIGQEMAQKIIESGDMIPIVTGKLLKQEGFTDYEGYGTIIARALYYQDRGTLKAHNWKKVLKNAGVI
jgi:tRNA nucleotidyltransferase (CCA-adding enzyme)